MERREIRYGPQGGGGLSFFGISMFRTARLFFFFPPVQMEAWGAWDPIPAYMTYLPYQVLHKVKVVCTDYTDGGSGARTTTLTPRAAATRACIGNS